ncbi:hypothetical protein D3C83_89220 [compost metagenome]
MVLPTTLTIPSAAAARDFPSRRAASVSAVSPLWLMTNTTSVGRTIGSRYRNSEA